MKKLRIAWIVMIARKVRISRKIRIAWMAKIFKMVRNAMIV